MLDRLASTRRQVYIVDPEDHVLAFRDDETAADPEPDSTCLAPASHRAAAKTGRRRYDGLEMSKPTEAEPSSSTADESGRLRSGSRPSANHGEADERARITSSWSVCPKTVAYATIYNNQTWMLVILAVASSLTLRSACSLAAGSSGP